jgi:pimeloyl-ACP methyl ester carboxylesterase
MQKDSALAQLGPGFASHSADVNGASLHYVRGGAGQAVILPHGFPQDWAENRKVMPALAKRFTVIAIDLPGIGGSSPTPGAYDTASMARHIRALVRQLDLGRAYLVGHDIGGMVAYGYLRQFPDELRGTMILDVAIPGFGPQREMMCEAELWHVHFHQVPGLAEKMVQGHQTDYFRHFLRVESFTDAEVDRYVQAYAATAQLHAMFEIYRSFPEDAAFNTSRKDRIDVPLLLAGGDLRSPFLKYLPQIADDARAHGLQNVLVETIHGSEHYVVEQAPERIIELITTHAS